jgi:hypothetical protein
MPQRFLKPGIVTSPRLARCSPWAQLLFYKLLNLVDDYARYDAHPLVLARAAFPYGDNKGRTIKEAQIEAWLGELEAARLESADDPCLRRYRVNGTRYLFLHRWTERSRNLYSRYPSPAEDVECWQLLSDAVKRQQMFAPMSSSSTTTTTVINRGNDPAAPWKNGMVVDSRAQFASVMAQLDRLSKIKARTLDQELDLKRLRRLRNAIQKKQAEGDFAIVGDG